MKSNRTKAIVVAVIFAVAGIILTNMSLADEKEEKDITGTIEIKNQPEMDFPGLASITLIQAINSGLSEVNGKALKAELEKEDGYLVYSIEIVTRDHSITELIIDAGSGKVLAKAIENDNESHDGADGDEEDDD